jgi:hypothetical protein
MRSSLARVAAFGSALTLAACAVIAGLDDPQTISDATAGEAGPTSSSSGSVQDTGSASSSSGSSSGSTSGGNDGASTTDGPVDAPKEACALKQNGATCGGHTECCSNQCNEEHDCVTSCKVASEGCDISRLDGCCVGLWCAGQCTPCRMGGQNPATEPIFGTPLPQSCCSRQLAVGGTCL